jgi:protease-4
MAGCLLAVVVLVLVVVLAILAESGDMGGLTAAGERIVLIRVEGMIVSGQSGYTLFGSAAAGSDDVVRRIEEGVDDPDIKGILLRIDSPGGSAAASQEIYQAIMRARDAGVVVVASMADVAASGGYYVAAPADHIFADPATVTGSIGAIAVHQDVSGLLGKIGVDTETIKAGELKDMFDPTAPLSDEAREIAQALVTEVHEQFIADVVAGRANLDSDEVRRLADGRIYTGQQAAENGLIDELGGIQDALLKAGELAGIEGKPELEEPGPPSLLRYIFGAGSSTHHRPVSVTGGLLYDAFAARLVQGALAAPIAAPEEQ